MATTFERLTTAASGTVLSMDRRYMGIKAMAYTTPCVCVCERQSGRSDVSSLARTHLRQSVYVATTTTTTLVLTFANIEILISINGLHTIFAPFDVAARLPAHVANCR